LDGDELRDVSAAAVPEVPEVWCPPMPVVPPGVVTVGDCGEPVRLARVGWDIAPGQSVSRLSEETKLGGTRYMLENRGRISYQKRVSYWQ
jgi:hypothetical protein